MKTDKIIKVIQEVHEQFKGGSGSGNFGHSGRPGKQGGSSGGGGSAGGGSVSAAKEHAMKRAAMLGYKITFETVRDGRLQIVAQGPKGKSAKKLNLYITQNGEIVNKDGKTAPGWL